MTNWQAYAKALTGAVIAGLTAIVTGLDDGGIDWQEIVTALIAFFVALGAVYQIPNRGVVESPPVTPTGART
jgi:hypothetical protein